MGRQLKVNYSSDKPGRQNTRGGKAPVARAPKFDQENELFVGSLSWNATEDDILQTFSEYGKVLNVKLLKDYDGRSRGRAYVKFADAAGAEAGCAMNGQEHMGRQLIVNYSADKPSGPSKTVVVRNMSYDSTEESVREFFASCGAMADVRIAVDGEGYAKGFAHIDFEDANSSVKACELSGSELDGRTVYIKYATERGAATRQQGK